MSILEVPGARLYFESHGSGPLLLLIPGAMGDAGSFSQVTELLSARYTVVTYDRRGFSRSRPNGPQDYNHRLETDADDVRRLLEHLSNEPATIFGASSGGVVALEVLTHYPSVVRTLVPFEPPIMKQLPDGQRWVDFFHEIYDFYRQSGIEAALKKFGEQTFALVDRQAMAQARKSNNGEFILANATYWFEHELRQYPAVDLDLTTLKVHADRIVFMAGRESRAYPAHEVNVELSKKLGRDLIELPGGHLGFMAQPAEFAREFVQALVQTRHG
jgi:acetyltransferase/esterase